MIPARPRDVPLVIPLARLFDRSIVDYASAVNRNRWSAIPPLFRRFFAATANNESSKDRVIREEIRDRGGPSSWPKTGSSGELVACS